VHRVDARPSWPVLEGVRGAAVVAVVLYHAFRLATFGEGVRVEPSSPLLWPMSVGRFGVDVFFVLSGLLVVRSWRTVRAERRLAPAFGHFMRRRLTRIGPAYWVSLAVLLPVVAPTLLTEPRAVALLASMNHYLEPGLAAQVNTPYWSLTTEVHFYLLVPLVVWAMRRLGSWPVLFLCLVGSTLWGAHQALGLPAGSILGRLDQFVAGAVVGEIVTRRVRLADTLVRVARTPWFGVVVLASILGIGTWHGATLGMARGRWFDPLVHPAIGLLVAAGLVRILTTGSPVLMRPRLQRLGAMSYSLYLCHYPVLQVGVRWLRPALGSSSPATAASVAILLPCAFAVGVAFYRWVERPALVRLRPSTSDRAAPVPAEPAGDIAVAMA
jgi:peptidoglycan/LPS O-acetylase OafA/YrhL